MRYNRRCYTTGVLNRHALTNFAHIEIANFSTTAQRVAVTVYNWDLTPPAAVAGGSFNSVIAANDNLVLSVPIPTGVIHYEVRLNLPVGEDVNVVANITGVTGGALDPNLRANQEGNTVLFRNLVPINFDNCMCA